MYRWDIVTVAMQSAKDRITSSLGRVQELLQTREGGKLAGCGKFCVVGSYYMQHDIKEVTHAVGGSAINIGLSDKLGTLKVERSPTPSTPQCLRKSIIPTNIFL